MFEILKDKTICLTRGDIASIVVSANIADGTAYTFTTEDVVRFTVCKMRDYSTVILQKDVIPTEETTTVTIQLYSEDTKIGSVINKPVDYWYEIELNPDTAPQTIIGHDEAGEKISAYIQREVRRYECNSNGEHTTTQHLN